MRAHLSAPLPAKLCIHALEHPKKVALAAYILVGLLPPVLTGSLLKTLFGFPSWDSAVALYLCISLSVLTPATLLAVWAVAGYQRWNTDCEAVVEAHEALFPPDSHVRDRSIREVATAV